AADFVYSWERLLDPKTKSPATAYLNGIRGAEAFMKGEAEHVAGLSAPDRYTFRSELREPNAAFVGSLALLSTAAVPREEVERWGEDFFRHPVGTGPFVLAEWQRDLHLRLERNPNYSLPDLPALDAVEVTLGTDDLTRQMMFERGELDLLQEVQ